MAASIDHMILRVNDLNASLAFYTGILGFKHDGEDGPFSVVRVLHNFVLLLAPGRTEGDDHLAFAMARDEFQDVFRRIREAAIAYGDCYDTVGSMNGPGKERGARGVGENLYVFDPDRRLVEIMHYAGVGDQ